MVKKQTDPQRMRLALHAKPIPCRACCFGFAWNHVITFLMNEKKPLTWMKKLFP
jgi:hypothetical protein